MSVSVVDFKKLLEYTKVKATAGDIPKDIQEACERFGKSGETNRQDPATGDTVLHQAIANGHHDLALSLLRQSEGAKPADLTQRNNNGDTIVDLSAKQNEDAIKAWVLKLKVSETFKQIQYATTKAILTTLKTLPLQELFSHADGLTRDLRAKQVSLEDKKEGNEIDLTAKSALVAEKADAKAGDEKDRSELSLSVSAAKPTGQAGEKLRDLSKMDMYFFLNDILDVDCFDNQVLRQDLTRCIELSELLTKSKYANTQFAQNHFLYSLAMTLGSDVFNGAFIGVGLTQFMLKSSASKGWQSFHAMLYRGLEKSLSELNTQIYPWIKSNAFGKCNTTKQMMAAYIEANGLPVQQKMFIWFNKNQESLNKKYGAGLTTEIAVQEFIKAHNHLVPPVVQEASDDQSRAPGPVIHSREGQRAVGRSAVNEEDSIVNWHPEGDSPEAEGAEKNDRGSCALM